MELFEKEDGVRATLTRETVASSNVVSDQQSSIRRSDGCTACRITGRWNLLVRRASGVFTPKGADCRHNHPSAAGRGSSSGLPLRVTC